MNLRVEPPGGMTMAEFQKAARELGKRISMRPEAMQAAMREAAKPPRPPRKTGRLQ